MGQLYKRIFERDIEVRLETKLNELVVAADEVVRRQREQFRPQL